MADYERTHTHLLHEIKARYPYLKTWIDRQESSLTLVIMKPAKVRDEFHRIVHDHELRERARPLIFGDRVNEPGDNAVLVLAPVQ